MIGTRLQFGVGEDIVFDFNANATLARVQTLLRALSFDNIDDDDPTPGGRMIDYTLTDGDGGTATFSSTVTVEAVDDTPTIGALDGDVLAYAEGDGLVAIDAGANAAVLDVDGSATAGPGDFGTGQLTLAISAGGEAAEDTLSILPSGPLTFDDTTGALGFGGTAFGTATGGTSGSPLVIALTAEADVEMVDALLRAVAYRNTDEDSPVAGDRTVDFSLVNGLTQVPNTVSATVSVSARNDFPSITDFTLATLNYAEGQGPLFLDIGAPAMVTDVDSPDFDGGLLRLAINAGGDAGEDILAIDEGAGVTLAGDGVLVDGIEIGTVTGGTGGLALSIALDEDATAATVARVIQRLTYENTDTDDPTGGARAVLLSISDGDVDPSGTRNLGFEIDVLPVDDPPEILELDGDVVPYVEGDGPVAVDRGTMLDIVDVDSDHFDGGTLRIALSDPSPLPDGDLETLSIRTANGVATPMPGVGNPLVVDGLAIGTIAAVGQLGAGTFFSLDVALNANATPERVARVLRELTYENAAAADLDEGARTLTVQLRDTATGPFATAEVTIDVADRPEPPVARDDAATVSEDGPETAVDVLANDSDANGDPLTLSAIAANGFAGTARIGAGGTILYDPAGAFEALAVGETAEDLINYTISDGTGRSGTAALRVTVEGANDAPVANNDIARVEAGPDEVAIAVLDNDSDVDASDQLTVVRLDTIDTDGTARILADGQTVIYVPDPALAPGSAAIDRLVYEVSDGNGGLATASITVLIGNAMPDPGPGPGPAPGPGPGPTGSPPVARDDAFGTGARQALSGKVLADNGAGADSDPDGGALTVNALAMPVGAPGMPVTLASGAVVTLSADGGFLYDPAGAFDDLMPGDTATDSFDYSVVDDDGLTDTATVSIDIAGPQFTVLIGTPAPDRFDIDSFGTPLRIEGLAEEDTVALPATLAEIDIEAVEGGFRIWTEDGQPIDLISVERIELADTTLVLCDTPEAATLFLLYQLILDRAPDPSGLAFWKASIAAGASFEFVAGKMIESDEFLDNFGVPESDAAFVEDRYLFGLERMPDMAGFDFWTGLLETGALSQAGMAVASSRSPELIEFYEAELANGWLAEEPTIL
ncbi:MAG: Ig-like domain-containing protein [Pseudomonadota bacterium]